MASFAGRKDSESSVTSYRDTRGHRLTSIDVGSNLEFDEEDAYFAGFDNQSVHSIESSNSISTTGSVTTEHHHKFRPKTLSIPGKLRPSPSMGNSRLPPSGSVPNRWSRKGSQTKNGTDIPRIKCSSHVSAPTTPLAGSGASLDANLTSVLGAALSGSIASIDEAQEATLITSPLKRLSSGLLSPTARAKLSLNTGVAGSAPSEAAIITTPSPARSPSLIPKFLQNSFSKLLSRERRDGDDGEGGVSSDKENDTGNRLKSPPSNVKKSHTFNDLETLGSAKPHFAARKSVEYEESFDYPSPTSAEIFEETKMIGLPVIPFAFPTSVIAEKLRNKKKRSGRLELPDGERRKSKFPSGDSVHTDKSSPRDIEGMTHRRGVSPGSMDDYYEDEMDNGPASLDNVVSIAQQEYLSESVRNGSSSIDDLIFADSPTSSRSRSTRHPSNASTNSSVMMYVDFKKRFQEQQLRKQQQLEQERKKLERRRSSGQGSTKKFF